MGKYRILANRQLTGYTGSDKYINVSQNNECINIFDMILSRKITTVNQEEIKIEQKGDTTNIHFKIKDNLLDTSYAAFCAKGARELRLQLTNYINQEKIIPGDIMIVTIERLDNDCKIYIKSERLYRYVLEKKSKSIKKYRVLIQHPKSTANCGISTTDKTEDYLSSFSLTKMEETLAFGKDPTEFDVYITENCDKKYIGIPLDKTLNMDCFDDIEEIIK